MTEINEETWDKFLQEEADNSALNEMAEKSMENLKKKGEESDAHPMARAYAKGISTIIASDTMIYLKMTLEEIAEEWDLIDVVDLLVAIAKADEEGKLPKCSKD